MITDFNSTIENLVGQNVFDDINVRDCICCMNLADNVAPLFFGVGRTNFIYMKYIII
jgi:hypothetical protein